MTKKQDAQEEEFYNIIEKYNDKQLQTLYNEMMGGKDLEQEVIECFDWLDDEDREAWLTVAKEIGQPKKKTKKVKA
jgi:hypothetical protein